MIWKLLFSSKTNGLFSKNLCFTLQFIICFLFFFFIVDTVIDTSQYDYKFWLHKFWLHILTTNNHEILYIHISNNNNSDPNCLFFSIPQNFLIGGSFCSGGVSIVNLCVSDTACLVSTAVLSVSASVHVPCLKGLVVVKWAACSQNAIDCGWSVSAWIIHLRSAFS